VTIPRSPFGPAKRLAHDLGNDLANPSGSRLLRPDSGERDLFAESLRVQPHGAWVHLDGKNLAVADSLPLR
jgi:hypothetical protein